MDKFTKVEYIEIPIQAATAGTVGVRIPFPSQGNLQNKLIRKIVAVTSTTSYQANADAYSPNGAKLLPDPLTESIYLTLQTTYDMQSGANNQGTNIHNLQLSLLCPVRAGATSLAEQSVIEWAGVFVNWEKSAILVNYATVGGKTPGGYSIVLAVFYDDMYDSMGQPITQPIASLQAQNLQLTQQNEYMKGMLQISKSGQKVGNNGLL